MTTDREQQDAAANAAQSKPWDRNSQIGCGVIVAIALVVGYFSFLAPKPINAEAVCTRAVEALSTDSVRNVVEGYVPQGPRGGHVNVISTTGGGRVLSAYTCAVTGTNSKNARAELTPTAR